MAQCLLACTYRLTLVITQVIIMLSNLISSYLQNQSGAAETAIKTQELQNTPPAEEQPQPADQGDYSVSNRAIMLSAIAQEFDITALKLDELGSFQTRLQEYNLVDSNSLTGLQVVYKAHLNTPNETSINAESLINQAINDASTNGSSYSETQKLGQLHRLFSNLASARLQTG